MGIYRREGKWYIDITIQGKRVRKVAGRSKRDAEILYRKYELDKFRFDKLEIYGPQKIKIDDLFHRYLQYCKDNKPRKLRAAMRAVCGSSRSFLIARTYGISPR